MHHRTPAAAAALLALAVLAPTPAAAGKAAEVRLESFRLLNEGVAAYGRGEFDLAVDALERAASMALNSFRAHYYLGLALAAERRYEEALDALAIALDLDPNHLAAHVAQGDAQLKLGDVGEARAAYYRALKLRPGYARAIDGLGRSEEAQADVASAVETYRRAILSDRGFAPAYTHLGDLYMRQGRVEEAVRLLEEAISIRPDFAPGHNRLALAYGRLGLTNQAVATVRRAMELEPGNAGHRETLGRLKLGRDQLDGAASSFEHALRLDPHLTEARLGLAEVWRRRGDYEAALDELSIARDDPRLEVALRPRVEEALARVTSERDAATALEARLGAADAPLDDDERDRLVAIYAGRGDWERALALRSERLDTSSRREVAAYLLLRAGRFREAAERYAALARETGEPATIVNHGVALAGLGDDEGAAEAFARALGRAPDESRARLYLANARLRQGRTDEAIAGYAAYLEAVRDGEQAERVRRMLEQLAPRLVPRREAVPAPPPPEPTEEEGDDR